MAARPVKTPARIPPQQHQGDQSVDPPSGTPRFPPPAPSIDNLAKDGYGLQAQLDKLEEHFVALREQLRRSQKLASLGTTAAMIAHEFNNLFTPVVAYARQALDTDDVDLMRTALEKTLERTTAMHDMADRIIGMAKDGASGVRSLKVAALVENAIGCLCRNLEKDNITVNLQIDPDLAVRANENQVLQVLFNLVINARQAMLGKPGRLTVDAAPTRDGKVEINVRDTGCGIAPENLERIFEPFFSTKQDADRPDRKGLGLGLSICQDIIQDLDGTLTVASEPGVGTTFTITLPKSE